MKIIVVYNHKGGVTKTTTSINSATFLQAYYDRKVCIIDCDDEQWSTYEEHQREMEEVQLKYNHDALAIQSDITSKVLVNYDVEKCLVKNFEQKLAQLSEEAYDYIFVDLGNRTLAQSSYVFSLADQIIVPYSNDMNEIREAIGFYQTIRENYPLITIHCVVVKIDKSRVDNHSKIKANLIENYGLKYYDNIILDRIHYVNNRSFFYPLSFKRETKDYNSGFVSFVEELIMKSEGIKPISNLTLETA